MGSEICRPDTRYRDTKLCFGTVLTVVLQKRKRSADDRSKQEPLNGEYHVALTRLGWVTMDMGGPDRSGVCNPSDG